MQTYETTKNGTTYKNIKFGDIPLNGSIEIEKSFDTAKEVDTKFGKSYVSKGVVDGEEVSFFIPNGVVSEYNNAHFGKIKVTRSVEEMEFTTKDGNTSKKFVNRYSVENVGEAKFNKEPTTKSDTTNVIKASTEPPTEELSEKQKEVLKSMIEGLHTPDTTIFVDGTQTTYKNYLGDNVVANPAKYMR